MSRRFALLRPYTGTSLKSLKILTLAGLAGGLVAGCDKVNTITLGEGDDEESTQTVLLRVNVGGAEYTAPDGSVWSADFGSNGAGTPSAQARLIGEDGTDIQGTDADQLFYDQVFDRPDGDELEYAFAVDNGTYTVRLHFAEPGGNFPNVVDQAGERLFDVEIEGSPRLTAFDIFARAGGVQRAYSETITGINVTDGLLNIRLLHDVENPLLAAIEVLVGEAGPDTIAPTAPQGLTAVAGRTTVALSWLAAADGETGISGYRIYRDGSQVGITQGLSFQDSGLTPGTSYTYTVTALDNANPPNESQPATAIATTLEATSDAVLRINAGGGEYVGADGRIWSGDFGFNTGATSRVGTEVLEPGNIQISGAGDDDKLFWDQRFDPGTAPELEYQLPVDPNTTYTLRLSFAENFKTSANERLFNVSVQDSVWLNDFDIFAEAGGQLIVLERELAGVAVGADGILKLNFTHVSGKDNPLLATIEVLPYADLTPPNVPTSFTATADFTEMTLSWDAATDPEGTPVRYRLTRDGVEIALTANTTFNDLGLTPGTSYNYAVTALDANNNESAPATLTASTTPPEPVSLLRVNVGGFDYTDSAGNYWYDEVGRTVGSLSYGYPGNQSRQATVGIDIAGDDDPLYFAQREGSPRMVFGIRGLEIGAEYTARLHFAENIPADAAGRNFNIAANHLGSFSNFATNYNIATQAGGLYTPEVFEMTFTTAQADVDIRLAAVTGSPPYPTLAAIEILGVPTFSDTTIPTAPTGLVARAGFSRVSLSWNASTDPDGAEPRYRIYRNGAVIATVAATTYEDLSVSGSTQYTYEIRALDQSVPPNVSAPSNDVTVTTLTADVTPPTAVVNPQGYGDVDRIYLGWSPATDDDSTVIQYRVTVNGTTVLPTTQDTHIVHSGLVPGITNTYDIVAIDQVGNESNVESLTASTLNAGETVVARINAGGDTYVDDQGLTWLGDSTSGGFWNTGVVSTAGVGREIEGTGIDPIYQLQRFDVAALPLMSYSIPVPNGRYAVRLHLSENFADRAGARQFNVNAEGLDWALNPYDIFAATGQRYRAWVETLAAGDVLDGELNITFSSVQAEPIVAAIEVIQLP